mgnify:CR=1 FL=1
MNYGFVINNRTCIGCHACSTACKSENEVPLGVYRTWVKNVESGTYPNVRRHFQVTRCNHCANPPCVRICPVTAMYQRDDGIVEFDKDRCIGCKACLQACPYDAIHVDPETGTAAKCHYCSHRTDLGLEPACVVVCPEHAIIAGDMDDPDSEISRVLASQPTSVRKPEQGTAPKLFYIDANDVALHPTATERTPETFMFSDVIPLHGQKEQGSQANAATTAQAANAASHAEPRARRQAPSGTPIRTPGEQGEPTPGPIQIGQRAEQMVQVAYNAQHEIPWHWQVPAYLVTKAISSGVFLLLAAGLLFGWFSFHAPTFLLGGLASLVFVGLTTAFLVWDLERPERFLRILLYPQMKSWLTRGAFILVGFSTVAGVWWLLELGGFYAWVSSDVAAQVRPYALSVGAILALATAVYTGFLFGQAEGRDLWQSPLLPPHLVVQAAMAGSGALLVLAALMDVPEAIVATARVGFIAGLVLDVFVTLAGEFGMPHASEVSAKAAHALTHGAYRYHYWLGSIVVGHLLPLALLIAGIPALDALAALLTLGGLYAYELAFVMAPQEIPNS